MRLIKLKVRNIASLKGEHEVDFKSIQRQSSLFAITGETGSGKSSILNSLGLALYGQIYKKNVNQLDVVTLGERDGSIELIFQVKGKNYLADWRARVRKQNGELYSTPQTPSRNLYILEGEDFDATKTISNIGTPELLNLDFDQFCKCIILNQGEFAKFLTSSFTERKDILEKLYPGEVLESMSKELKLELDTLQKSKEALEIELQALKGDGPSGEDLKIQEKELLGVLSTQEEAFKKIETLDYHFIGLIAHHEKYRENQNRILKIKHDMGTVTAIYNALLKEGQALTDQKENAQKELETRLPSLQILLKKEEALKNNEQSNNELIKKRDSLRVSFLEIEKKNKSIQDNYLVQEERLLTLSKEFKLSLELLKKNRSHFNELLDLYSENELLQGELTGKNDLLKSLEETGKELKAQVQKTQEKILIPAADLKKQEAELLEKKKALHLLIEQFQRDDIKSQELKKSLKENAQELVHLKTRLEEINQTVKKSQTDLSPIETTLKLQEVLGAAEVCINHVVSAQESACPVCHQDLQSQKWLELQNNLAKTDLNHLKKRASELQLLIVQKTQEEKLLTSSSIQLNETIKQKEKNLEELSLKNAERPPSLDEIELKIAENKKSLWDNEAFEKEVFRLNLELTKARDSYRELNIDVQTKTKIQERVSQKLQEIAENVKELIPIIHKESVTLVKNESRKLGIYLEEETRLDKLSQEKNYLKGQLDQNILMNTTMEEELLKWKEAISSLKAELSKELGTTLASDLIHELNQNAKITAQKWSVHEQNQKKHELDLKEFQSRLYELSKLTQDYDLQFSKELQVIRDLAKTPEKYSDEETLLLFKRLSELSLELSSEKELFIPLKEIIESKKIHFKTQVNETRMKYASVKARFEDWEKLQDKILIIGFKHKDLSEKFERRFRLYEVLGKDELRTFVLSLVEENLIEQTNQELQKLCQGRYEILHQSRKMKMTPEFYILDKFREGGLRKVSTLSGGETFMVSLAMALGLAEMTRGQAEIDSLFIDEGFGTLDQDSLDDVLDMLQQIQTRGLMVGIISHIKNLTSAIPVNLVLTKKQDGTSNVSMKVN